jgi:hypothetical protein
VSSEPIDLAELDRRIGSMMEQQRITLHDFWARLHASIERGFDAQQEAGFTLGTRGWTLPVWAPINSTARIVEGIPAERLDEAFVREYHKRRPARLMSMFKALEAAPVLSRWRLLLEQCMRAHAKKQYLIVVPSLLVIFEGLVAHAAGKALTRSKVRRDVAAQKTAAPSAFDRLMWATVEGFAAEVFANVDFGGVRPLRINRHWVLHGRDAPLWMEADSLRLFQAIETVAFLIEPDLWIKRAASR